MSGIRISAVVCTHNRRSLLLECLESLSAQTLSPAECEIIVVDNRSTDGTREAVERYAREHPSRPIVLVCEEKLGLAASRNTGIRVSRGDVVAFIDDDAFASPQWLATLLETYAHTGAACVGGRVVLEYRGPRPGWLTSGLEGWLSGLDLGAVPRALRYPEQLVGANISFHKEWLDRAGGVETSLGRKGKSLASGEDTDLLWKVQRMGGAAWYAPEALVVHRVIPERLTRRWYLRRTYQGGRSNLMLNVRYEGRLKAVKRAGYLAARLVRQPLRWFPWFLEAAHLAGYLRAMGHALFPPRAFLEEWAVTRREATRRACFHRPEEVEGEIGRRMGAELDGIRVLGHTLAGRTLRLYFKTEAPPEEPLIIFSHLYSESRDILPEERRPHGFFNLDHRPAVPTDRWRKGMVFVDEIDLGDIPAGNYRLVFGFCDAKSLVRLPVHGAGNDQLDTGGFNLG